MVRNVRFSEQANVILEAVGETMEKKLDDKFDPVIICASGGGWARLLN
jgi:hypothetical protein